MIEITWAQEQQTVNALNCLIQRKQNKQEERGASKSKTKKTKTLATKTSKTKTWKTNSSKTKNKRPFTAVLRWINLLPYF